MARKVNKVGALNMTQIEAETDDGTVVISGSNVYAAGKSVRVSVRSATGLACASAVSGGNASVVVNAGTFSIGHNSSDGVFPPVEVIGESDDYEDEDIDDDDEYDEDEEDDDEEEEDDEEDDYDIDEDN